VVHADTLSDILTNVKNNANAVQDMTATASMTYVNPDTYSGVTGWEDVDECTYMRKGASKFRSECSGDDERQCRMNEYFFWFDDGSGWDFMPVWYYFNDDHHGANTELLDFATIIDARTWYLHPYTSEVEGVTCYKIYSADVHMYVDVATKTKVMKAVKYGDGVTNYAILSDYSYVENTAYMPGTILHVWGDSSATISMSSIDINEDLADSLFAVE